MVLIKKTGRAKIPITWIKSDASRHVTFTKRKKGLKKKVEELAILCGVEVCMICFGPQVGKPSSTPYSWGLPGVAHVINKYRSLSKEEQDKKKLDNTSLLEQQIKKLKVELKSKMEQNRKMETDRAYMLWDQRLDAYNIDQLKQLAEVVLDRVRQVYERISYVSQHHQEILQGFGKAMERHPGGPLCGDENTTAGDGAIRDLDVLNSAQLNHELIMSSQAGPYHQLMSNLNPYNVEHNPSSSYSSVMDTNSQRFQEGLVNQISLLGLPAYIDEQKANMPMDGTTEPTNSNFFIGASTVLPLSADGSFQLIPSISLKMKEEDQLPEASNFPSNIHPALLKMKLNELLDSNILSNLTWQQAVGLQTDDQPQFGRCESSPPHQTSEHHEEQQWSSEKLVEDVAGKPDMGQRGVYMQEVQNVSDLQLCHVNGHEHGCSSEDGRGQPPTITENASIQQMDVCQLSELNASSKDPSYRGAINLDNSGEHDNLTWSLEDRQNKMSVYQAQMLTSEDRSVSLENGLTTLDGAVEDEGNDG
ncbi:hypothetical protein KP509_10G051500 [Ceratopteris richardii]|uniref:MADS-box domain-containing protein n=1 Tax=Ceratopteris richardii TaxID=49495 RepID=A0A8T2U1C1_CERRI|nr:hypothetical protein KP509_10G051500 [Ceratopteris richardii]